MRNIFLFGICLLLFACGNQRVDLELKEIRLTKRSGECKIIEALNDLKNEKDTSYRLEVKYLFNKKAIKSLVSGLLQIDNTAFFKLYLNGALVFDKSSAFFLDTLISAKKDSFLYAESLYADYFLHSTALQKSITSGNNLLLIKFTNPKYCKLKHNQTRLFLSKNNANYPSKSPIKKTHPSKLPWISINANSGIKDDPKSYAKLRIKNGATLLQENIKIEIRGSTSQSFKKKSFSFLFLDENNNPKKVRPIGLPEHEHWVLYGPYADKSLSRNVLAYSLWGKMGYYAPKTKFCELSINGAYQGVYVLCEKIRVDSERLDLKNGYLLKIDRPKGAFFKSTITNDGVPNTVFEIKYPDITEISISEKNAVENFIHLFEEALFLSNPSSLDVFEIIDMNSFIDFLIINELCKNIDAYRLSTYFQITENKKVVMGPVWDFNFSLGLTNYLDGHKTDGFVFESMNEIPFWWKKLLQNIYFKKALKNRWNELRMGVLSDSTISNTLTIYADELVGAQKNNFEKWNLLDQKEVWPNYYIGGSHQDEVNYINTWILNRAKWLDNLWKN